MNNYPFVGVGEEFNQLARLLFDAAANKWYAAVLLEVGASILAAVLGLLDLPTTWSLVGALVGIVLLAIAYGLRIWFDDQYDTAETMRRQAAFTEGLGWPIDRIQAIEWQRRVGARIRQRYQAKPRDPDYYASKENVGPGRLAEMTIESAFYTRQLYLKLRNLVVLVLVGTLAIFALVTLVTLAGVFPGNAELLIARALYSFIPIVLAVNLFGWTLQLDRLARNICEVEEALERLKESKNLNIEQVLRIVSEYNCQAAVGFPIHKRLFDLWHDEIRELWQKR